MNKQKVTNKLNKKIKDLNKVIQIKMKKKILKKSFKLKFHTSLKMIHIEIYGLIDLNNLKQVYKSYNVNM